LRQLDLIHRDARFARGLFKVRLSDYRTLLLTQRLSNLIMQRL
jgi:hypothetical protein